MLTITVDQEKEASKVLTKVREILSDPSHWTKGKYARRAEGGLEDVKTYGDKSLVCFCLIGAVWHVIDTPGFCTDRSSKFKWAVENVLLATLNSGEKPVAGCSVETWNDAERRTHADVLALLDRAIERLK